jgi:hypothetical protein
MDARPEDALGPVVGVDIFTKNETKFLPTKADKILTNHHTRRASACMRNSAGLFCQHVTKRPNA